MKILIATDGSKYSEAAVEKVCQMIKNAETAEIKIVSVYDLPIMAVSAPYALPAGYNPALETELKKLSAEAVSQTESKIRKCFQGAKVNITTRVLCGEPKQAVVEEAEEWGADLLVVGSHGYGFWERMFLGSVSSAVVHHAPCSVLVVRV